MTYQRPRGNPVLLAPLIPWESTELATSEHPFLLTIDVSWEEVIP